MHAAIDASAKYRQTAMDDAIIAIAYAYARCTSANARQLLGDEYRWGVIENN